MEPIGHDRELNAMSDAREPIRSDDEPSRSMRGRDWLEAILLAVVVAFVLRAFVVEAYRIPSASMENTLLIGDYLLVNKFVYGAKIPFTNWRLPALKAIQPGDVIVFAFPRDESITFIKRCAAVAGQTIEIRDKVVFVDDVAQPLPPEAKAGAALESASAIDKAAFPLYAGFNRDHYDKVRVPKKGDTLALDERSFYLCKSVLESEGHSASLMGGAVYLDGKPCATYVVQQNYYFALGDNRDASHDSRYWGFVPESNIIGSALLIYWSWNPDAPNLLEKFRSMRWERIGKIIH